MHMSVFNFKLKSESEKLSLSQSEFCLYRASLDSVKITTEIKQTVNVHGYKQCKKLDGVVQSAN